ncbi:transposon Tn21 resolvase [Actinoplanes sp. SE50]|nr:transposon Tn21 resolvase [Actinoplanes sp. SE50]SLM03685.1 putative resolvase-like protein fragment [Actinoplanes sp. SE50/110]
MVRKAKKKRVGYIRVSTVDQNTVRQLDGIEVERVFTDKASGKDTTRPALDELIAYVRDGDTVLVHSMDRLARNLDDLRRLVRTLTGKAYGSSSSRRTSSSPARTPPWPTCCSA